MKGLALVAPEVLKPLAIGLLMKESGAVVREICEFLICHPDAVSADSLMEAFQTTERDSVKRSILKVFDNMTKWKRLLYLVRSFDCSSGIIADQISDRISNWLKSFNNSFVAVQSSDVPVLLDSLSQSQLPKEMTVQLKSLLNQAR